MKWIKKENGNLFYKINKRFALIIYVESNTLELDYYDYGCYIVLCKNSDVKVLKKKAKQFVDIILKENELWLEI